MVWRIWPLSDEPAGNIYVTGQNRFGGFPTFNAFQPNFGGGDDANNGGDGFVAKYDHDGSLIYATYLGGAFRIKRYGIAVDAVGNAYVTGKTMSADFPIANDLQPSFGGGGISAFVAKLNPTGSANELLDLSGCAAVVPSGIGRR